MRATTLPFAFPHGRSFSRARINNYQLAEKNRNKNKKKKKKKREKKKRTHSEPRVQQTSREIALPIQLFSL